MKQEEVFPVRTDTVEAVTVRYRPNSEGWVPWLHPGLRGAIQEAIIRWEHDRAFD